MVFMNKSKKLGLILIGIIIITPLFSQSVSGTITFGGQSIEVSPGDYIVWTVTNATASSPLVVGDRYNVTFQGIGQYYGRPGINTSIGYYNISTGTWRTFVSDIGMFTFNTTSGDFSMPYTYTQRVLLMLPQNMTLAMLGEIFVDWGPSGYSVTGNLLNVTWSTGYLYIEVNSYGIVTKCYYDGNSYNYILEYSSSSVIFGGGNIPFGTTFLAFGILGVLCVSIVVKKKMRYS